MIKIPKQLQNPEFRFYLIGENSKLPIEQHWNAANNYIFCDDKLLNHNGNYGISTGHGNLIILDFDSKEYADQTINQLPNTFTVLSATKRLPHLYYILKGEMFRKVAIYDKDKKTLCDIQAERAGIVGPGSCINNRFYMIFNNKPIQEITLDLLQKVLKFNIKKRKEQQENIVQRPDKTEQAIKMFNLLNIQKTGKYLFQCPFHEMHGKGNLSILDSGRIYCFHEQKTWPDIITFIKGCYKIMPDKHKLIEDLIQYGNC